MASKVALGTALVCQILSFILLCIGCGTGFWYVAGGEGQKFKNIGLWKVCFDGFEYWSDYIGKAYYGCWWIFHKEYWYIHEWLLPSWFIATQVLMVFASTITILLTFVIVAFFLGCCKTELEKLSLKTCAVLMTTNTILVSLAVLIFATMSKKDRTWMPKPEINNLGWSFGLTVVSVFFSAFGSVAIITYMLTIRHDDIKKRGPSNMYREEKSNVMPPVPRI